MRPSLVHEASTFEESRAFRSKSIQVFGDYELGSLELALGGENSYAWLVGSELHNHWAGITRNAGIFGRGTAHAVAAVDAARI